jgi:hypothetical protein
MGHSEAVEALRSIEPTRNGIGARLRIDQLSSTLVVVQSWGDVLALCPEHEERAYRLSVNCWNDYHGGYVNMLRDYESGRPMGIVEDVEVLPGWDVDELERDYGIEGQGEGPWATPRFFTRRPYETQRIRRVA